MRVKRYELLRRGHEYMSKPKSTSDVGESYEDTGMAGLAARTAKSSCGLVTSTYPNRSQQVTSESPMKTQEWQDWRRERQRALAAWSRVRTQTEVNK
jgi:hypothetical protein